MAATLFLLPHPAGRMCAAAYGTAVKSARSRMATGDGPAGLDRSRGATEEMSSMPAAVRAMFMEYSPPANTQAVVMESRSTVLRAMCSTVCMSASGRRLMWARGTEPPGPTCPIGMSDGRIMVDS